MRFMRLLCAAAYCALALAQYTGRGTISGTVVESVTSAPVVKALVTLTLQGTGERIWASCRTDHSGQFRFERLPAGKYDLRAVNPETGIAIYGASGARETGELITLEDGEARTDLKLRFLRFAAISGKV